MSAPCTTEEAIALGISIRGDGAAIWRMNKERMVADELGRQCLAARDFDRAMLHAVDSQFYREAVEAATMTGGIGDLLRAEAAEAMSGEVLECLDDAAEPGPIPAAYCGCARCVATTQRRAAL